MALGLIVATILVAAGTMNDNSRAGAAALPFAVTPGTESPVRATKGDRIDLGPQIRTIAGVTMVLRDFDRAVR